MAFWAKWFSCMPRWGNILLSCVVCHHCSKIKCQLHVLTKRAAVDTEMGLWAKWLPCMLVWVNILPPNIRWVLLSLENRDMPTKRAAAYSEIGRGQSDLSSSQSVAVLELVEPSRAALLGPIPALSSTGWFFFFPPPCHTSSYIFKSSGRCSNASLPHTPPWTRSGARRRRISPLSSPPLRGRRLRLQAQIIPNAS